MFSQKIAEAKSSSADPANITMPTTLSEMLVKSKIYQEYTHDPDHFRFTVQSKLSSIKNHRRNYSQTHLLKKIRSYLNILGTGKEMKLERGYCHGITLTWLTMMSLGVEKLFYAIVRQICNCNDTDLLKMTDIITFFLDLIDKGQRPEYYSQGTCRQYNVDKIIGNANTMDNIKVQFKWHQAERKIKMLTEENTMTCVTVWGYDKYNPEQQGHTVGFFHRDNKFLFFDPNYLSCKPKKFTLAKSVANEIWHRNVSFFGLNTKHGLSSWYRTTKLNDDFQHQHKMA